MTEALGVLAALSTLACLAILVRVHLLPTGRRPVSNSGHYRAQTAANAYAALFLAAGLAGSISPVPQRVVFLLLVFAVARLAIPSYPADADRSRPTGVGRAHIGLAGLAFGSIAWAAAILPVNVPWHGQVHDALVILGWIVVATAIATGVASAVYRALGRWIGGIEWLFYAAMLAWFLVVSIKLI